MTPAARIAAAIEILDDMRDATAAEKVLTDWGRRHRFAGSGDRAAIRDLVFDALRRRRSYGALGGGAGGRALMLGALRHAGTDPETVFTGQGHAPPPLSEAERRGGRAPAAGAEACDCPDWLWPLLSGSLGAEARRVMLLQRDPAPVALRVNLARAAREDVRAELTAAGIVTRPDPRSPGALVAEGRPRGIAGQPAYRDGRVELQDVGAQLLADLVPLAQGQTLLDFCAGGGGKTLALAARVPGARFVAHDAAPRRMADLPARAARAGVPVEIRSSVADLPQADTVLIDVPCSGSGTWRRGPDAKWRLDPAGLDDLMARQDDILDAALPLVRPGGYLVYATCSLLRGENEARIESFLTRAPRVRLQLQRRLHPDAASDGFFVAVMAVSEARKKSVG